MSLTSFWIRFSVQTPLYPSSTWRIPHITGHLWIFTKKRLIKWKILLKGLFTDAEDFIERFVHRSWGFYWKVCSQKLRILLKGLFTDAEDFIERFVHRRWGFYWKVCSQTLRILLKGLFTGAEDYGQVLFNWLIYLITLFCLLSLFPQFFFCTKINTFHSIYKTEHSQTAIFL